MPKSLEQYLEGLLPSQFEATEPPAKSNRCINLHNFSNEGEKSFTLIGHKSNYIPCFELVYIRNLSLQLLAAKELPTHGYWYNQLNNFLEKEDRNWVNIEQNDSWNSGKNLVLELDNYHFSYIKSEYMLHWIWYPIIAGRIGKSWEVMLTNEIFCSFSHNSGIEFIHTVVSKMPLEWIHDGIIIYLVVVNLTFGRKTRMEFRQCRANLSHSDIQRKKTIQSCMNVFQVVIAEWCDKMCNLNHCKFLIGNGHNLKPHKRNRTGPDPRHELPYLSCLHQPSGDPSFQAW